VKSLRREAARMLEAMPDSSHQWPFLQEVGIGK
jgi:hypothetical protein